MKRTVQTFLAGAVVLLLPLWRSSVSGATLDELRVNYEQQVEKVDLEHQKVMESANAAYGKSLAAAVEKIRATGDLQGTLAAMKEKERFDRDKSVAKQAPSDGSPLLEQIHSRYWESVNRAEDTRNLMLTSLIEKYIATLKTLQKNYVIQGKIPEAMEVDGEVKKVDFILADVSSRLPSVPRETPSVSDKGKPAATRKNDLPVRDGLVVYYNFDGNLKDVTGNAREGSLQGGASWAEDRFGKADKACGVKGRQYIKIDHEPFDGLQDFTVCAWVMFTHFNKTGRIPANSILSIASNRDANEIFFWYSANDGCFVTMIVQRVSDKTLYKKSEVEEKEWHHVVLVRRGDKGELYLDGAFASEKTVPSHPIMASETGGMLGQDQDSLGGGIEDDQGLDGVIDDFMCFNRALSKKEIREIYESQKPEGRRSSASSRGAWSQPATGRRR